MQTLPHATLPSDTLYTYKKTTRAGAATPSKEYIHLQSFRPDVYIEADWQDSVRSYPKKKCRAHNTHFFLGGFRLR